MRRPGSRLTFRAACAAAVAALACALAAAPAVADQGDILVKPDAGTSAPEREALRADAGVRLVKPLPVRGIELVHPEDGDGAAHQSSSHGVRPPSCRHRTGKNASSSSSSPRRR